MAVCRSVPKPRVLNVHVGSIYRVVIDFDPPINPILSNMAKEHQTSSISKHPGGRSLEKA